MAKTSLQELIDTKKAQLASNQVAIKRAENRQSSSLDDGQGKNTVALANLQTLYDERDKLQTDILELEHGSSKGFYGRTI